jgi:hypothetical protein
MLLGSTHACLYARFHIVKMLFSLGLVQSTNPALYRNNEHTAVFIMIYFSVQEHSVISQGFQLLLHFCAYMLILI